MTKCIVDGCLSGVFCKGMHRKTYRKYFSIKDIESAKRWREQKELELYGFAPGGIMIK